MSKIAFTVSVPHDGPHIPQFSISCNNATYLSFKGTDIENARWGNGNVVPKKGWKRLEFGVTGGRAATRFSVMVNTSVVLPPLAWSTPGPAPAASAAQGGSTATRMDLKVDPKMLRETEGEKQRLRIEDGDREWKEAGHRRGSERKEGSRAERGERVRRSDRRRRHEDDVRHFGVFEDSEADEKALSGMKTNDPRGRGERVRRRERRRSYADQLPDKFWDKESKQRMPHCDVRYDELGSRRTRQSSAASETGSTGKRVAGKKINTRYRNPSRTGSTADGEADEPDRGYRREESSVGRYHKDGKNSYRRSERKGSLKPVDWGYQPDIVDNGIVAD